MNEPEEDSKLPVNFWTMPLEMWAAAVDAVESVALRQMVLFRYSQDFLQPFFLASKSFKEEESGEFGDHALESVRDYAQLLGFN